MEPTEVEKCFDVAMQLVKEAGKVVREAIKKQKKIETKSCSVDLVTESDKAVEKFLIARLSQAFPAHKFIAEESTDAGTKCVLTDDPTWIIDPIDGTMNFVHGLPYICISVALWVGRSGVLGIVYNPVLEQMFTAKKGCGAYLNGERIYASGCKDLSHALVFAETFTNYDPVRDNIVLTNLTTLIPRVHGVRALGSFALDMCMVACGGAEAIYEFGIHAWDTAAAVLLVTEAGGVVMDTAGGPFDLMRRRVLCAATPELAEQVTGLLKQYQLTPDGDLLYGW